MKIVFLSSKSVQCIDIDSGPECSENTPWLQVDEIQLRIFLLSKAKTVRGARKVSRNFQLGTW